MSDAPASSPSTLHLSEYALAPTVGPAQVLTVGGFRILHGTWHLDSTPSHEQLSKHTLFSSLFHVAPQPSDTALPRQRFQLSHPSLPAFDDHHVEPLRPALGSPVHNPAAPAAPAGAPASEDGGANGDATTVTSTEDAEGADGSSSEDAPHKKRRHAHDKRKHEHDKHHHHHEKHKPHEKHKAADDDDDDVSAVESTSSVLLQDSDVLPEEKPLASPNAHHHPDQEPGMTFHEMLKAKHRRERREKKQKAPG